MSALQNFVTRPGSAAGNSRNSGKTDRARLAANAKVAVHNATGGQQGHTSGAAPNHHSHRKPSNGPGNAQFNPQQGQIHDHPRGSHVKRDPFDTDAESIDTTARGNESISHGGNYQNQEPGSEEHYGQDGEDYDFDDQEEEEFGLDHPEVRKLLQKEGMGDLPPERQMDFLRRTFPQQFNFDPNDSYPTTTSGANTTRGFNQDQGIESDDFDDRDHVSHSTEPVRKAPRPQTPIQLLERAKDVPAVVPNVYQNAAFIRNNSRPTQQFQGNTVAGQPPSQPPPTYSQTIQNHNPPASVTANTNQAMRHQNSHGLSVRGLGGRQMPSTGPLPALNSAEPALPVQHRPVPTKAAKPHVSIRLLSPQLTDTGSSSSVPSAGNVEDYDRPTLFNLEYEALKKEPFDTVPRGIPPVIPDEIKQQPLENRLDHVQKNMDPVNQGKFFSALPTREWEDAGDWFLNRFTDIINRTREARQTKRKLAQGFEDEVEKRHEHVEKKQKQVVEALGKMSAQGEGLIPKSPGRGSRTPVRR